MTATAVCPDIGLTCTDPFAPVASTYMPGWVALAGGLGTVALATSAPFTRTVRAVPTAIAWMVNGPLAGSVAVPVANRNAVGLTGVDLDLLLANQTRPRRSGRDRDPAGVGARSLGFRRQP